MHEPETLDMGPSSILVSTFSWTLPLKACFPFQKAGRLPQRLASSVLVSGNWTGKWAWCSLFIDDLQPQVQGQIVCHRPLSSNGGAWWSPQRFMHLLPVVPIFIYHHYLQSRTTLVKRRNKVEKKDALWFFLVENGSSIPWNAWIVTITHPSNVNKLKPLTCWWRTPNGTKRVFTWIIHDIDHKWNSLRIWEQKSFRPPLMFNTLACPNWWVFPVLHQFMHVMESAICLPQKNLNSLL